MLLFETIMIMLYMINESVAFIFSLGFFIYILMNKKENMHTKVVKLLVLSAPLFSISIIGSKIHHIFSWTYIFLAAYIILLLFDLFKKKYRIPKNFGFILLFSALIFLQCFIYDNKITNLIEFFQIMAMMLPITLTSYAKDYLKKELSADFISNIKYYVEAIIIAMAISVLFQYGLFNIFDINIGNISLFSRRIIYDSIFNGYSILSIFLGLGIVIYVYDYIVLKKKPSIIKCLIILLSLFLNSSRTGLVSTIVVVFLIILKNSFSNKKINKKNFGFLLIFSIMMLIVLFLLSLSRGDSSLLSSSGRDSNYLYALQTITSNFRIFMFGNGLSFYNYRSAIPHNFILQTWVSSGIIILVMTLYFIRKLLNILGNNIFKYIVLCVIIGALFTTDIYANTFLTIFVILGLFYNSETGCALDEKK